MASLRKMLGRIDDPVVVSLMCLIKRVVAFQAPIGMERMISSNQAQNLIGGYFHESESHGTGIHS